MLSPILIPTCQQLHRRPPPISVAAAAEEQQSPDAARASSYQKLFFLHLAFLDAICRLPCPHVQRTKGDTCHPARSDSKNKHSLRKKHTLIPLLRYSDRCPATQEVPCCGNSVFSYQCEDACSAKRKFHCQMRILLSHRASRRQSAAPDRIDLNLDWS